MILSNETPKTAVNIKTDEIYCQAVNIENTPDNISKFPHEKYNDLAVIYYFQEKKEETVTDVPITYNIMELLGISEPELKSCAWRNTLAKKKAILTPLTELVGQSDEDALPLYVLTNDEMRLGAVAIFYPLLLDVIAEEFGRDLCIIPCSIHECLLMPRSEDFDAEGIRKIIKNINDNIVSEDEILSYNLYRYDRAAKAVTIDNT